MSNFTDKLKSGFGKGVDAIERAAKVVADEGETLIEKGKRKAQIAKKREEQKKLTLELGSMVYRMYQDNATEVERLNAQCAAIQGIEAEIAVLQQELETLKSVSASDDDDDDNSADDAGDTEKSE